MEQLAGATTADEQQPIFVSYSRQDVKIVRAMVDRLRNDGAIVIWDQDFTGGADFEQTIRVAIDAARCVIVVWSPTSVLSPYVRDEARRALKVSKLLPTHVAGLDLADVPLGFGHLQIISLDDAERIRKSLAALGINLRS